MELVHYHEQTCCNKCSTGINKLTVKQTDGGYISEAETVCEACGHCDYWAYGFFDSGQEMVSNCKKYTTAKRQGGAA